MLRLMRTCVGNSMPAWMSYRSFWQKWHFISGDKISCKHHPKWNAYTCPWKYRVALKCSRNETSCEQNLFSLRFEISNRYEFISSLMWTCSISKNMGHRLKWKTTGLKIKLSTKEVHIQLLESFSSTPP